MGQKRKKSSKEYSTPPKRLTLEKGKEMRLDHEFIVVEFEKSPQPPAFEKSLNRQGYEIAKDPEISSAKRKDTSVSNQLINHTRNRFWIRSKKRIDFTKDLKTQFESQSGQKVNWLSPVYKKGRGKGASLVCLIPNVLLIKINKDTKDYETLSVDLVKMGLSRDKVKSEYLEPYGYYKIENVETNIFDLWSKLTSRRLDVRFEIMPMLKPTTLIPNDTLFANQWNIDTVHAADTPMAGWDLTIGNENVVIAIIDSGCDLQHPDLNFSGSGINLGNMSGNGGSTGSHGTACAGIAAAIINNNEGIAGIAGACSILPIAFQNWTDAEVAAGIRYATNNGAHVISMSFGQYAPEDGISPSGWGFDLIDPAIDYAYDRGVVLVAATGNENINNFNRYPARHPLVIAVGASDQNDNRKSPSSPDGENWGSNYADGVSVVAPGVLIPTTDRRGNTGYSSGNYTLQFNGTSSAAPHVAGLAALLKNICPTLSALDIQNIIERTCDKVGTDTYQTMAGYSNGIRNQQMGYGRINVSEAIREGFLYLLSSIT